MAPGNICVLVISAGVMSVTGLLTSWMMGFEKSEITIQSFKNQFTIRSNANQTTTAVDASVRTDGLLNTPKAQIITNFLGIASVKTISGTSVVSSVSSAGATDDASGQTAAGTTALSTAGSVQTTAGGTITSSTDSEEFKTDILPLTKLDEILETVKTTLDETDITCTEITESTNVETLTDTVQPERMSVSDIIQTQKSETDATTFGKPKEVSITVKKQESGTTPTPEPMTDRATNVMITSEKKATSKTSLESTFRITAILTKTEVDSEPSTVIKRLKTAGTEPYKVEISETTTVRPQESTQTIKTSSAPTMSNEATGMNLLTMIQSATETQDEKQLSTHGAGITIQSTSKSTLNKLNTVSSKRLTVFDKLSTPSHKSVSACTGKCQTKSTTNDNTAHRGQKKKPPNKTLYSAVILGCILVIGAILVLIMFVKDFVMYQ